MRVEGVQDVYWKCIPFTSYVGVNVCKVKANRADEVTACMETLTDQQSGNSSQQTASLRVKGQL